MLLVILRRETRNVVRRVICKLLFFSGFASDNSKIAGQKTAVGKRRVLVTVMFAKKGETFTWACITTEYVRPFVAMETIVDKNISQRPQMGRK